MAQYKVPQDVEADDKLLGPFSFRQFVYLMIVAGCIGLCVALFQIFPLLAIIPVPFAAFFALLALPLKKDQPMETYLAAIVTFYLKPRKRLWTPGQKDSTIMITAPKIVEKPRARDLTGEEASHRLSFLANVIDTEGYSLQDSIAASPMRDEFAAEAETVPDILDTSRSQNIGQMIVQEQNDRHAEIVNQMREAINRTEAMNNYTVSEPAMLQTPRLQPLQPLQPAPAVTSATMAQPMPVAQPQPSAIPAATMQPQPGATPNAAVQQPAVQPATQPAASVASAPPTAPAQPNPVIVQPEVKKKAAENRAKIHSLAHSKNLSIATIQKEADRINKEEKEVYISLH